MKKVKDKDLRNCPFCPTDNSPIVQSFTSFSEFDIFYQVLCPVCKACGPPCLVREEAARRWNTRRQGRPRIYPDAG